MQVRRAAGSGQPDSREPRARKVESARRAFGVYLRVDMCTPLTCVRVSSPLPFIAGEMLSGKQFDIIT